MPSSRQVSRIDTSELKAQIEKKVGIKKAEKYFNLVTRYLSLKISKPEFDRLCIGTIGKDNVCLHNHLIRSILKNACLSRIPPPKTSSNAGSLSVKVPNGRQGGSLQLLCRDLLKSPRKGRTPNLRDRRLRENLTPNRSQEKNHISACQDHISKIQEQERATELISLGSRPPISFEDGEEVDQASESPSIHSMSPLRAPLGIPLKCAVKKKLLIKGSVPATYIDTCQNNGELPDTSSLRKRLEQKLKMEGMEITEDCTVLLNSGLDIFLKRLIKPSLSLARSKSVDKHIGQGHSHTISGLNGMQPVRYVQRSSCPNLASILEFQVAMGLNPLLLGEDWPTKLEKVCLHESQSRTFRSDGN